MKFVAAMTRVAPLQQQTIPRLELLSALLLARLLSTIAESLEFEFTLSSPYCFTDSMVSLWSRVQQDMEDFRAESCSRNKKIGAT